MANNTDIKWIKQGLVEIKDKLKDMVDEVSKTNESVQANTEQILKIDQKQKDHFFWHNQLKKMKRHTETMSRTQVALLIAAVQMITMIVVIFIK